jgi:hypothetical protein
VKFHPLIFLPFSFLGGKRAGKNLTREVQNKFGIRTRGLGIRSSVFGFPIKRGRAILG